MKPFTTFTALAAPLDRSNVDTDQIIPKQFLKRIERTGFGEFLFFDWRFLPDGSPNPDFELNHDRYAGASILVAGRNFGSGSSREHAVWALDQHGFKVIVAPSFADIFYNNSLGNGLLLIALRQEQVDELTALIRETPGYTLTADLEMCTLSDGRTYESYFDIDAFHRHRLLNGLDDIGLTLEHAGAIEAYEQRFAAAAP